MDLISAKFSKIHLSKIFRIQLSLMPTLLETIGDYEEDLLLLIAGQWGIESTDIPTKKLAHHIAEAINPDGISDFLDSLPENELTPLRELAANQGRIPWPQFERKFGGLREMGAARRQRERPDIHPASQAESLFYKGLIGKAFFDARGGPSEFAYIPDEILPFFQRNENLNFFDNLNRLAKTHVQKKWIANDFIIDHACTALAALRSGIPLNQLILRRPNISMDFLVELLKESDLISSKNEILAAQTKTFLECGRGKALFQIFHAWSTSENLNELQLVSSIEFGKAPANNPRLSRSLLLELISSMPEEGWFGIDEFVGYVHDLQPDILRRAGEYDAWFIKNQTSGELVSGFESWHLVEGEYLRMMIKGPCYWLGLLDLGKTSKGIDCFRRSSWSQALLRGNPPEYQSIAIRDFHLEKTGQVSIDRYFPRDVRYQLTRFCEWSAQKGNHFFLQLTPGSLQRATAQGLKIQQLISIIHKFGRKPIPANLLAALEIWGRQGVEAQISREVLLRVKNAAVLDSLMDTQAKSFIRERLGKDCALVNSKGIPTIKAALLELGYFTEIDEPLGQT